ncbi:MAG TPA: L-fucokinase, partial [Armatimonadota bacterium]|nr:L-fucokinase [Armatimonadota bacterium]
MPGTESLSNVDLCVLTAQNAAQARHFESQVRHLQATGVLPPALRWAVVPDPPGPRLGTGGATLHAVCAAVDLLRGARRELTAEAVLAGRRVLVIHSGGLSQRLPQFSALGKVFAPLPGSGLSSRPLLVQVLANLGQLADRAEDGVFVACGDALMQCDVSGLALPGAHAAVFVAPAAPEQAARHGVYQWDTATGLATAVYQKPSPAEQRESGLLTRGRAWLDTGVLYLSTAVTSALIGTLGAETRARPFRQRFLQRREHWEGVELYKDVTGAMVPGQTGDSTLRRALERFQLHVLAPDGARFLHFGTTAEFIQTSCDEATTSTDVTADGWLHPEASIDEPVEIQTSLLEDCGSYLGPRSIVQYAHCSGALHVGGDNHVFGLRAEAAVTLPPETLLYQAPI